MYADVDARAGVLEPEGLVEIKCEFCSFHPIEEHSDSVSLSAPGQAPYADGSSRSRVLFAQEAG